MDKIILLTPTEYKDLQLYCKLNNLNEDNIIKSSYLQGYGIEKYGLLSESAEVVEKVVEKIVEKRVEIPVEVIKEVVKIEYVEVEKPVEVIKEVPVEKIVYIYDKKEEVVTNLDNICDKPEPIIIEKIFEVIREVIVEKETTDNSLKPKLDALQNTVQKLKQDNIDKDKLIREYEQTIKDIQVHQQGTKAMYMRGSNLDEKLYTK